MTTNLKGKTPPREAPTEPFKRAVTSCLRALAREPELEVTFAAERPGLSPRQGAAARAAAQAQCAGGRDRARPCRLDRAASLPAMTMRCIAAWRRRTRRRAPCSMPSSRRGSRRSARAACRAWRRISRAMLDDHFHRGKFDEITDRADAPLAEALAMIVRESLTGQPPPPAAKKVVELWRSLIEDKAGARPRPARPVCRGPVALRRRRA